MSLATKRFDAPDEVRSFDHGHMDVVDLEGRPVGLSTFEPGWRWSDHMKAKAGTDWCQVHHFGYVLSGTLGVRMDDGTEVVTGPGAVFDIPPGHDGWVMGDEACVLLDWGGALSYAKS